MNGILNFGAIVIEVIFDPETSDYTFVFSGADLNEPVTITGNLGD